MSGSALQAGVHGKRQRGLRKLSSYALQAGVVAGGMARSSGCQETWGN